MGMERHKPEEIVTKLRPVEVLCGQGMPLAKQADPSRLSDRAKRDGQLKPEIERVFEANQRSMAFVEFGTRSAEKALTLHAALLPG